MILRSSAVILLSAGLALAPIPAAAQTAGTTPPPSDDKAANLKRAEELYSNGERLYKEGSYEAAILAFQESYELSKEPSLLFNIGNAYERLGDFANARRYLDQYRAFAPEKERELLSRRIQALDQRQRDKELKDQQAADAAKNNNNGGAQTDPQPPPTVPPPDQPVDKPKQDRVFGPAAIGLTAGIAVGLGVGVGMGVKALGEQRDAEEGCMTGDAGELCSVASQDALDKRKTSALVADIGFAVAGAAAIALIAVVAVKASKKKRSQQRAQLAPYATPRGGGLGFSFRF
jgi:tetratricopeptide (TPR) repeat protein